MVAAVQAGLRPLRSQSQAGHEQRGQGLLPGVLVVAVPVAAVAVPVAAAPVAALPVPAVLVAQPAPDWPAADCQLGFALRACQPAVWGQAGGRHGVQASVVDLRLGLVSHW